ncbi:hypothetical protein HYV87_05375 [Candidatus Woesearchaeota archaeon]|nr:hypothetical protein [Candidatus Woesearchaeota archaeon]MBI2582529.1 hypothetical protein [Candidatus Woesearchaeota archaeon]
MRKKAKKRDKNRINAAIVLVAVIVLASGILIFKKPSITGFAVLTEEKTYDDNLNLVVNESKEVIWNLRNPGDLKTIKATGAISRNGSAKVYIQKDNERVLLFDSTKVLFDVNVQVLPDYKKIFQGEELLIQIVLFNLKGFGSADVDVKYSIKDPHGALIAAEEEIVTVETQAKFVRKLLIPSDLKAGAYVAFVEVKTPDGLVGTSSDVFEVNSRFEEKHPIQIKYVISGLAIFIILIIIIIFLTYLFKRIKKKKKAIEVKEGMPKEKTEKLEKELAAMESAFKSGLISEESYMKDKGRIEKQLGRLGK